MHSHDDRLIKKCSICQKNIKEVIKRGKELDRLGVWNFPKKWRKGISHTVWERKKIYENSL